MPILRIRLELINNEVTFQPPLDESTSKTSVREIVDEWLTAFVDRGKLVQMLGSEVSDLLFQNVELLYVLILKSVQEL